MERNNKQNNKNLRRISPTMQAIIASIVILIGGFFLFHNMINSKKIMAFEYMDNLFYQEELKDEEVSVPEVDSVIENVEEIVQGEEQVPITSYTYIGYLEIPKINLKKGFVNMNSKDNNVEKNIYIVPTSTYPDVENGNMIIAGHSGSGYKAFFNDLYQLTNGDEAYITYQKIRYHYQVVKIYQLPKTGKIAIYRDYNKTTLTLVTCTNHDDTTQTIYILELIDKSSI